MASQITVNFTYFRYWKILKSQTWGNSTRADAVNSDWTCSGRVLRILFYYLQRHPLLGRPHPDIFDEVPIRTLAHTDPRVFKVYFFSKLLPREKSPQNNIDGFCWNVFSRYLFLTFFVDSVVSDLPCLFRGRIFEILCYCKLLVYISRYLNILRSSMQV